MNSLPPSRDLPHLQARRAHLVSELRAPRRRRPSLLLGGLLTATATAAAVIVPVTMGRIASGPPDPEPGLQPVSAAQVLTRAAERARTEPELRPKPGQYLYFEQRGETDHFGRLFNSPPPWDRKKGEITRTKTSYRTETWYPVGGQRPGLARWSGENFQGPWPGELVFEKAGGAHWLCKSYRNISEDARKNLKVEPRGCKVGDDHYRTDLPTDVQAMYEWLYAHTPNAGGAPSDFAVFQTAGGLIRDSYVPPKARTALFAAVARIPGATVTEDVTSLGGGEGVAVGMRGDGTRYELIFDATTFAFLGNRALIDRSGTSTSSPGPRDPELERYVPHGYIFEQTTAPRVTLVDGADRRS